DSTQQSSRTSGCCWTPPVLRLEPNKATNAATIWETSSELRPTHRICSPINFGQRIDAFNNILKLGYRGVIMDRRVQATILLMLDNLHREISLAELAQSVRLSPTWFCHLFKAELGISPEQYFKMLKMQMAANLLGTSMLSIKEIMSEVGINDK